MPTLVESKERAEDLRTSFVLLRHNATVDLCEEAKLLALLDVENEEHNVDRIRRVQ